MNEAMPIPAVSQIAERPQTVSATPKMSGAPHLRQRALGDGQDAVPRPVQECEGIGGGFPKLTSATAATGCTAAATRVETSGWNRRSSPNSSTRAATCAGPISASAAMATAVLAPAA